jgi:PAS domain S-box-containing protein
MGVLDLFHAGFEGGERFVWLHSTATFIGGLLFAGVWLPPTTVPKRWRARLVGLVLIAAMVFGVGSCLSPSVPATTTTEEGFSPLSRSLNIGGGAGFLLAGIFFIRRFHRRAETNDWLFALHTMLFGAAGVLFELSKLWDGAWWWWHILRLMAYVAAFVFAVSAYLSAELAVLSLNRRLTNLNRDLDETVESRTSELRASEERYSLAVRGSTDGIWDWDLLTNEVFYSPRFKELLGYSDEEYPHRFSTFESTLHPDDIAPVLNAVQAHLCDRVPYDIEYRLKTKAGVYRWFRARGQAIWSDSGKATRMAGSITDVTDRKIAEASLNQERFLFQTLLDRLPDAIYFKDTEGRFTRVTASLARSLGAKEPSEVIGKTDADFFPASYAEETRRDEQRLMVTGIPMIGKEERPNWSDQRDCWVSTTKVPLRNESGDIIGTFGISHDITEQKLAQERFRGVIEAAPNAMVVVNAEGRIQFANAATERMFGYDRAELIDQEVEVLVPDAVKKVHAVRRQDYMENPQMRTMGEDRALTGRRKDGSSFPIEIGLSPIHFDGETVVLSSIEDSTKRKQAEEALVSAKEAAEAANRAKSDFLANMSHEIRTPMNAIIGLTELLLESQPNQTQTDYLKVVLESAESLLSIINQILDFSKIEAGRLELETTDFNLHELVGDTLRILGHRAHAKQLELVWYIETDVPNRLRGDPARLRQVLINLVGNAIKFTDQGEVVVRFRHLKSEGSTVTLTCTVSDTGIGIPAAQQQHIFDAFQQADTSTTRLFGGTGLGLAISSRIIAAMGGEIRVESDVDQGSRFEFTIEFDRATTRIEDHHSQPADVSELSDLYVVVVDDNATNRRILKQILDNWGMDVTTAESASEAIERLEHSCAEGCTHQILISDVHMPHVDGFMLAQQIRSHPQLQDTPIILLSSGGHPGDVHRCEQLGIDAQLMKPAKHSELMDAIASAAGKHAHSEATEATQPPSQPPVPARKILLVEDGKANQVLATRMLQKWGHQVELAENGEEAIEFWQNGSFDLILMDVQMPVLDGLEATRRIRKMENGCSSHVPIVAMTAHAMKGDRDRCIDAGMDAYIPKPFRQQELNRVLGNIFSDASVASASESDSVTTEGSDPNIAPPDPSAPTDQSD